MSEESLKSILAHNPASKIASGTFFMHALKAGYWFVILVLEFLLGKETWDQGMLKALSANDQDLTISSISNTASINSVSALPSEL